MPFRRKLLVLDKAHTLFLDVNRAAPGIRKAHQQSLKRQVVKSALSISSNIAEGRTKRSEKEFLRFLDIALGSCGELQYQLQAATDCGALPHEEGTRLQQSADEVAKMTQGLINRISEDLRNRD